MLFALAIEKGDDKHAYGVTVPDIPGCFSAGDTFEEAVKNAREAIEGHLEVLCEDGVDIPQASDISVHIGNPEFDGYVWALVDVDITPYLGKSQKVNVTLPDLLIKQIDDVVARVPAYKSRSGFLATAALHELQHV